MASRKKSKSDEVETKIGEGIRSKDEMQHLSMDNWPLACQRQVTTRAAYWQEVMGPEWTNGWRVKVKQGDKKWYDQSKILKFAECNIT